MGATRNVALNELPIRGISINDVTANSGSATVNIVASDSGVIFINKYVTADVTYSLPAVATAAGKMFWFFDAQTTKNIIVNAPANTMFMGNDLAASTATTTAEVGCAAFVICDGTYYYFFEIYGAWANA